MKHRFEVLDIFRGLFASMVFLFHLSPFTETPLINNELVYNSDMFVDFFFVLSGFVIAYRYEPMSAFTKVKSFYRKRLLRIYPLHFFMLMAFLVVEIAKQLLKSHVEINNLNNPNNNIYTFITNLFLLNSFPLFGVRDVSWNIPSWSISAEMAAYLVFGLLLPVLHASGLFRFRNLAYGGVLLLAGGSLYLLTGGTELNYSFDYGFIRGILGFFTGVLCFNAFIRSGGFMAGVPRSLFHIAELLSLGMVLLCIYKGSSLKHAGMPVYESVFFLCIYIFSFEKGFLSSGLKKIRILHRIGQYSYSIYMTHALMISLFNVLFIRILRFPPSAYAYLFVLNYILIYLTSAWTYKHIEQRFYHRKRKQAAADMPGPGKRPQ